MKARPKRSPRHWLTNPQVCGAPWWLVLLSMTALLMTLTGCVTTMGSSAPTSDAAFCTAAQPISWSKRDTDVTIVQIKEHNAVGHELCGWGHAAP
jgi:hypothetical protein